MTTKKIYIVRHGETEYNRLGIVQGSGVDSSLNETGIRQSELFYRSYSHISYDKIYTSCLSRTIESVRKFINTGIPHEKLCGLNEISWGKSEGVAFNPESNKMYQDILETWKNGNVNIALDGGECPEIVKQRQEAAIHHILSKTDEKLVLICTHGRAMKILLAWLTGRPISDMDLFEHLNMSLYVLNYSNNEFNIEVNNDTSHLNNLI